MLAVTGIAVGGWLALRQSDLPPISSPKMPDRYRACRDNAPGPVDLPQTQRQLGELARLAPDWAVSYGDQLVHQALIRWPDQARPLAQQWRQQLSAGALPAETLPAGRRACCSCSGSPTSSMPSTSRRGST